MTAHQGIPITRNPASPAKAAAIRAAVAGASMGGTFPLRSPGSVGKASASLSILIL